LRISYIQSPEIACRSLPTRSNCERISMAGIIYGAGSIIAFLCACLLLRGYSRSRYRLLLWGGLCFVGLTACNILLIIDKVFLPTEVDLSIPRHLMTLTS